MIIYHHHRHNIDAHHYEDENLANTFPLSLPEYHHFIVDENEEEIKLIEKRNFYNQYDNNGIKSINSNFDQRENERKRFQQQNNRNNFDNNRSEQCRTSNGYIGVCWPNGLCHYQYGNVRYSSKESCRTSVNGNNVQGVCCPLDINFTPDSLENIQYRLIKKRLSGESIPITQTQFLRAIKQADADVERYLALEELFTGELGQVQIAHTPAFFLQMMFGPADQNQQLSNLWGFRALQLTRALGENLNLTPKQLRDGLSSISMHGTPYEQYCLKTPECDEHYPYRTMDGSCNNLHNPLWGKSLTQYNRLLPPEYSDGISELRISVNGFALPPPRIISTK
ncbi:hypothetical protein BLA29_005922, partial [Euroglyphus maynei]